MSSSFGASQNEAGKYKSPNYEVILVLAFSGYYTSVQSARDAVWVDAAGAGNTSVLEKRLSNVAGGYEASSQWRSHREAIPDADVS